jgi:porin
MFLNTSMGIYPSTALNLPLSIYPVGAGCILLKWAPTDAFTLQTALYEGAPVRLEENPHNLKRDIQLDKRAFSTVEVQYHRIREGITKGSYKMGAFYHKGNLGDLSDSSRVHPGAGGLYFTADQLLWQETHGSAEGLGSFLQVGTTPGTQNLVNFYLNAGLHYQGLLSARPQDLLGIAFVYSSLNNAWVNGDPESRLPHRSLIELTYKARLGPHFSLQPDLQYIIHPGADAAISNSFIGMLRWSLHY